MKWSDPNLLKSIDNPSDKTYEIKIKCPEITFLGKKDQPDYAHAFINMHPGDQVIELKSLKQYLHQFRNKVISYERLINVIYDDLLTVYKPQRLRLMMELHPRGGILSRLTIDSDWKSRGGKDLYKQWTQEDQW